MKRKKGISRIVKLGKAILLWGRSGRKLVGCPLWKERKRSFEDAESNQAIKYSFMASFLEWVKLYIDHHSMSMIDFVEWSWLK
ncbi:hypothetical protein CK203_008132 [Vitis vinifera]|uniref:Uncharacterized protein n=1 Tax=Vitis vinifera TaxID=29760 RepID=A0A438KNA5_VITVI|nr:hypothetical protein CK203_008132 [Vitis vinifera]